MNECQTQVSFLRFPNLFGRHQTMGWRSSKNKIPYLGDNEQAKASHETIRIYSGVCPGTKTKRMRPWCNQCFITLNNTIFHGTDRCAVSGIIRVLMPTTSDIDDHNPIKPLKQKPWKKAQQCYSFLSQVHPINPDFIFSVQVESCKTVFFHHSRYFCPIGQQ